MSQCTGITSDNLRCLKVNCGYGLNIGKDGRMYCQEHLKQGDIIRNISCESAGSIRDFITNDDEIDHDDIDHAAVDTSNIISDFVEPFNHRQRFETIVRRRNSSRTTRKETSSKTTRRNETSSRTSIARESAAVSSRRRTRETGLRTSNDKRQRVS